MSKTKLSEEQKNMLKGIKALYEYSFKDLAGGNIKGTKKGLNDPQAIVTWFKKELGNIIRSSNLTILVPGLARDEAYVYESYDESGFTWDTVKGNHNSLWVRGKFTFHSNKNDSKKSTFYIGFDMEVKSPILKYNNATKSFKPDINRKIDLQLSVIVQIYDSSLNLINDYRRGVLEFTQRTDRFTQYTSEFNSGHKESDLAHALFSWFFTSNKTLSGKGQLANLRKGLVSLLREGHVDTRKSTARQNRRQQNQTNNPPDPKNPTNPNSGSDGSSDSDTVDYGVLNNEIAHGIIDESFNSRKMFEGMVDIANTRGLLGSGVRGFFKNLKTGFAKPTKVREWSVLQKDDKGINRAGVAYNIGDKQFAIEFHWEWKDDGFRIGYDIRIFDKQYSDIDLEVLEKDFASRALGGKSYTVRPMGRGYTDIKEFFNKEKNTIIKKIQTAFARG